MSQQENQITDSHSSKWIENSLPLDNDLDRAATPGMGGAAFARRRVRLPRINTEFEINVNAKPERLSKNGQESTAILMAGRRIPMDDLSRAFLTVTSESLDTVDGGFLTNDR